MTNDEITTIDEKEPGELVKEEVSDLLPLYNLDKPTKEDIKEALEEHFEKFSHVGFNSSADEDAVEIFYAHFARNTREYLDAELSFIQDLLKSDLSAVVEQGYVRAKAVLPQEDYKNPQTVFVMNGPRTDAKVMGNGQFGINLQNLFAKVYSGESKTYDEPEALDKILNFCAHEGNHVLLRQVECTEGRSANWLVNIAFGEGLATFTETKFHFPWSEDYLKDSQFWLETVKQVATADTDDAKAEVLKRIGENEALKKHNPEALERTRLMIEKGVMTDKDFKWALQDLLINKNGPLYYAGYAVWKKINDDAGIDEVRRVVKQGPAAFEAYM